MTVTNHKTIQLTQLKNNGEHMNDNIIKNSYNEENYNPNAPAVSVIVPIYNVDKYLNRCIDSIINQIFSDIEIILVNDGSLDRSPQICDNYARTDSRVKVIHNQNGGPSIARNTGIEIARGKYLAFVDSDDYIDPSYLAVLYYAAERNNCDISYCNYAIYKQEKGTHRTILARKPLPGISSGEKIAKLTVRDFRSRSYLWNKLFRRELFFNDKNIRFPVMYFEDIATTARLISLANKVVVIDKCLYYYTKRKGSIVSYPDLNKMNDYILSLGVLRNFFDKHGMYKKYRLSVGWLGFLMFFGMPANIAKAYLFRTKSKHMLKKILSGIWSGWKSIFYFLSGKFKIADDDIPDMPYPVNRNIDD